MRKTPHHLLKILTLLMFIAIWTGCGVGYRYGTTSIDYSPDSSSLNKSAVYNQRASTLSTNYHELRLIDTTGLLMAGIVNTSRQYTAREEAVDAAKYKRDGKGRRLKEVDYSYKPYGVYPGARVTVDFRLGTDPTLAAQDTSMGNFKGGDLSYWGADVVGEFYQMEIPWLPRARATFFFGARFENVDYGDAAPLPFSSLTADVTFGSNLGIQIWDILLIGTVDIGMVSPVIKLLVGGEETSYLNGTLGLEAIYYPIKWLGISANLSANRWLDGTRNVVPMRAGIGLVLESDFGLND